MGGKDWALQCHLSLLQPQPQNLGFSAETMKNLQSRAYNLLEFTITGIWGMRKGHCITCSHLQKPGGAMVEPRASMDKIKHQGVKNEGHIRAEPSTFQRINPLVWQPGLITQIAALAQLAHTLLGRAGLLHSFPHASKSGRRGPHSHPLQLKG